MMAADIAKALGGHPTGGGRYLCQCPVPTHGKGKGDRNPSLSVYDGDEALLVKCFAGCDWRDVIDELRRRSLLDGNVNNRIGKRARPKQERMPQKEVENPNCGIALKIWDRETEPLIGTLGATYFTDHRNIDFDSLGDLSHCLRWHAGKRMVVALMCNPLTGETTSIHRIFLNADGSKRKRMMLGPQGVIRLSPDDAVSIGLGICEGIEDGLAVLLSGWSPVWVTTSAGAIRNFPVLSGIEALTIFADQDTVGMEAAGECAARWHKAGLEATIVPPPGGVNG